MLPNKLSLLHRLYANLECLFLTFCLTYFSSQIAVRNLSEQSYDFSKELNENKFNLLEQIVLLLHYFIKWRRKKIHFQPFLKVLGPIDPCCVCHTTESALETWTRWAGTPTNPGSSLIHFACTGVAPLLMFTPQAKGIKNIHVLSLSYPGSSSHHQWGCVGNHAARDTTPPPVYQRGLANLNLFCSNALLSCYAVAVFL